MGVTIRILVCSAADSVARVCDWQSVMIVSVIGRRFSGWSLAFLDYSAEKSRATKRPVMASLLTQVRTCPCAVVRRGVKVTLYTWQPKPGLVRDWLENLREGSVTWSALETAD